MSEKKKHVHVHKVRERGTSAHTKEELEQDTNAAANSAVLVQGTFRQIGFGDPEFDSTFGPLHKHQLKGSTTLIVAPEEFSGSNYDQTFLQGADVRTFEQATSYLTAKVRTNTDYNVIRSNKLGELASNLSVTSSFPYTQHRVLSLDEPQYFDDNLSPGNAAAGSSAQLDTSSNRRKPFIFNKHYRERRDLGQHELFPGGIPYKDTTTVDPTLIVGQQTGYDTNNIEFPPYMVHATDRISSDGAIEAYPIRSVADRSSLEHPHTARGIKSDMNLIDAYRKSDTMSHQTEKLGDRKIIIGRKVLSHTSIVCNQTAAANDDYIEFTIRGITCKATIAASIPDPYVATVSGSNLTINFLRGSTDKEMAQNLEAALTEFRKAGARLSVRRSANSVFLRETLDRVRTKGVKVTAHDQGVGTTSDITDAKTSGGFTIEFARYSDLIYEGSKTRALSGYDYYLDGVESFGIEVLDDAERVKLLTSSKFQRSFSSII